MPKKKKKQPTKKKKTVKKDGRKREIEGYYVDDNGMQTLYKNRIILSHFLTKEND